MKKLRLFLAPRKLKIVFFLSKLLIGPFYFHEHLTLVMYLINGHFHPFSVVNGHF